MHSFNPFLRAFFKSTIPSQCNPVNQHVLLVPTTQILLTSYDKDSGSNYADLAEWDEFLESHVLRISPPAPTAGKEHTNIREHRSKARQYTTVNGRTVVIKDSFVYSNKGFRNLNQAQLLSDTLYYRDGVEAQQWLIYYISKPLVGTVDPIETPIAKLPLEIGLGNQPNGTNPHYGESGEESGSSAPGKKEIKTFGKLLTHFPLIARQMQPGLDKVFKELARDMSKQLRPERSSRSPARSHRRRSSSASSSARSMVSVLGGPTYAQRRRASFASGTTFAEDEEDHLRRTLESAVTAAIDQFQLVDKHQLSVLGATTDLTGPIVERLIERYVVEQVHDSMLFPRVCAIHRAQDVELEACIRHMVHVDIAQVGVEIDGGRPGKDKVAARLNRGIEEFRNLKDAETPQRMLEVLLETHKIIASSTDEDTSKPEAAEKTSATEMNADTLVSFLLIVVIRAQVRHLQARLAYMRQFIFIDDVEGGEYGYALSTLEAVLSYLTTDSGGLRIASRRNRRLWQATKNGNLSEMKVILEPDDGSTTDDPDSMIGSSTEDNSVGDLYDDNEETPTPGQPNQPVFDEQFSEAATEVDSRSENSNLSHVFPFEADASDVVTPSPRKKKRVSIDLRSLNSDVSVHSRTSTLGSLASGITGDTSIEKLCQTQDLKGNSILMMAVDARQPEALDYLLSLEEFFSMRVVMEDVGSDGQTLLSAGIQSANVSLIDLLVDYVFSLTNTKEIRDYIAKPDNMGRTAAHYLFQAPYLLPKLGALVSWRQRDKNGQTPLLALCRAYDHPDYIDMVNQALTMATQEQGDGQPLHMDNHVDNKGNTLLHIVTNAYLALRMLQHCDIDPNASNEKRFTPLMIASKFGRFETVRAMFSDQRIDIQAKEYRGMTAVELAKDDEVRNRIDDLVLVSNIPASDGRVTAVVRSFFVEDATIRVIIKTAARSGDGLIAVTTTRRSLSDFEQLAKWLALEHPASWLPSIFNFRSPFQLPSKPSRAVLRDIQVRLDKFLEIMLAHPTFSTHELLWEFILVPELQLDQMAQRSLLKSDLLQEQIQEEYEPVADYREVETFITHARDSVRPVNAAVKDVLRRANAVTNALTDVSVALQLAQSQFATLDSPSLSAHASALAMYARATAPAESDPWRAFTAELQAVSSTISALLAALARPHAQVAALQAAVRSSERLRAQLRRPDRWPPALGGLLEESRRVAAHEVRERLARADGEAASAGRSLRHAQATVAAELAGWHDLQARMTRRAVRGLARRAVVRERDRMEGLKRAVRIAREGRD